MNSDYYIHIIIYKNITLNGLNSRNPLKALLHPLNSLRIIKESSNLLISFLHITYSRGGYKF